MPDGTSNPCSCQRCEVRICPNGCLAPHTVYPHGAPPACSLGGALALLGCYACLALGAVTLPNPHPPPAPTPQQQAPSGLDALFQNLRMEPRARGP